MREELCTVNDEGLTEYEVDLASENFRLRQDIQNIEEALYELKARFEFLDSKCKESNTGVTIERWNAFGTTGSSLGVRYRLMWRGHVGRAHNSMAQAIDDERGREALAKAASDRKKIVQP